MSNKNSEITIRSVNLNRLFFCPECNSTDVIKKFLVPISHYGHLPTKPKDVCRRCGFQNECFTTLNIQNSRHEKLSQILEDGI